MNELEFPKLGLRLMLSPTAISIGGYSISWYGIMIAIGFLLALWYGMKNAKRVGVLPDKMIDVVICCLPAGIIGARLYYVFFSWDSYRDNLLDILKIWNGGLAIYGGVIGAIVAGFFVCKWRKVKFSAMLDLAAPGFLIGQGIGRWGNFFNIEAYGSNTTLPWGMWSEKIVSDYSTLSSAGEGFNPMNPVHPCFLYESLWCILGFFLIHFLVSKHRKFDGQVFLTYLGWYGLERLFVEGLRIDSLMLGNLRVSQVLAGLLVAFSVVAIIVLLRRQQRSGDPEFLKPYVASEAWQEELVTAEEATRLAKEKKERKKAGLPIEEATQESEESERPLDAAVTEAQETIESETIKEEQE